MSRKTARRARMSVHGTGNGRHSAQTFHTGGPYMADSPGDPRPSATAFGRAPQFAAPGRGLRRPPRLARPDVGQQLPLHQDRCRDAAAAQPGPVAGPRRPRDPPRGGGGHAHAAPARRPDDRAPRGPGRRQHRDPVLAHQRGRAAHLLGPGRDPSVDRTLLHPRHRRRLHPRRADHARPAGRDRPGLPRHPGPLGREHRRLRECAGRGASARGAGRRRRLSRLRRREHVRAAEPPQHPTPGPVHRPGRLGRRVGHDPGLRRRRRTHASGRARGHLLRALARRDRHRLRLPGVLPAPDRVGPDPRQPGRATSCLSSR